VIMSSYSLSEYTLKLTGNMNIIKGTVVVL
jgi:hypothetical protein